MGSIYNADNSNLIFDEQSKILKLFTKSNSFLKLQLYVIFSFYETKIPYFKDKIVHSNNRTTLNRTYLERHPFIRVLLTQSNYYYKIASN